MQPMTITAPKERAPEHCGFWIVMTEEVDGRQMSAVASAGVTVEHLVYSLDAARRFYNYSREGSGAYTDIAGLGDEGSIGSRIYVRKGLLTVSIGAPGRTPDERQQAIALARRVVARMP